MSYILDALKRSEQERHQDKMPSFSAENMILQTNQKKSPWWPYALILVLILNALALYFFNRDASVEKSLSSEPKFQELAQSQAVEPISDTTSNSNRRAPPANVIKEREYIKPIKKAPQPATVNEWQSGNSDSDRTDDHLYGTTVKEGLLIKPKVSLPTKQSSSAFNTSVIEESQEALVQINPSYALKEQVYINQSAVEEPIDEPINDPLVTTNNFADTPLLTTLDKSFQKSIPELTFNSHIYSDKPSQRRVMINNYYLKEGQSFDGLELLEIGELFIKVNKDNTAFKLPVLRDWDGI